MMRRMCPLQHAMPGSDVLVGRGARACARDTIASMQSDPVPAALS